MKDLNIIKIVCSIFLLIIILFIILLFLNRQSHNVLQKNAAISVCLYVVTNKVNQHLKSDLIKSMVNRNNLDILVYLSFKTYNPYSKQFEITEAKCTFDKFMPNATEIKLKKFFFQDIYKNTYMYFNAFIKVNNIRLAI